jgi:hypothetical protein
MAVHWSLKVNGIVRVTGLTLAEATALSLVLAGEFGVKITVGYDASR